MSRRLSLVVTVLVGMLVSGCAPGLSSNGQFPIIGSDPAHLVETMVWEAEAPAGLDPDSFEEPMVLGTSSASVVQIAIKGGGCPPTVQASVSGDPQSVTIVLSLGGAIEPAGVSCSEILTAHVLNVHFREPIALDGLAVSAVRTIDPRT